MCDSDLPPKTGLTVFTGIFSVYRKRYRADTVAAYPKVGGKEDKGMGKNPGVKSSANIINCNGHVHNFTPRHDEIGNNAVVVQVLLDEDSIIAFEIVSNDRTTFIRFIPK